MDAIHALITSHMSGWNSSLVMIVKLKEKENVRASAMLLLLTIES
jgi:hypothetical protein